MDEPVEQRVRAWCEEEKLFRESIVEENSVFHLEVAAPSIPAAILDRVPYDTISVVQQKADPDRIVVFAGIDFGETFDTLGPEQAGQIRDMEMALEGRPEAYLVDGVGERLRSVLIFEEIFLDGLTKDRFVLAVRGVSKSFVVALWYLEPFLDELAGRPAVEKSEAETPPAEPVELAQPGAGPTPAAFCRKCGHPSGGPDRYCRKCGHPLVGSPSG